MFYCESLKRKQRLFYRCRGIDTLKNDNIDANHRSGFRLLLITDNLRGKGCSHFLTMGPCSKKHWWLVSKQRAFLQQFLFKTFILRKIIYENLYDLHNEDLVCLRKVSKKKLRNLWFVKLGKFCMRSLTQIDQGNY